MTPEQRTRLAAASAALAEVAIDELDPETWTGAGVRLGDLTKQERGDRLWDKKNAAQTLVLLMRIQLLTQPSGNGPPTVAPGEDPVSLAAEAENQAAKAIADMKDRAARRGQP